MTGRNTGGSDRAGEKGVALVYMAVTLTTLLLSRGLPSTRAERMS